jgi:hypothetical protein
MNAKVGPVRARFAGTVRLEEIVAPERYRLVGEGKGGIAGFAKGGADVALAELGPALTRLDYVVKAQVGGKLAQLGARLIEGTARQYAEGFFAKLKAEVEAPAAVETGAVDSAVETVSVSTPAVQGGLSPLVWGGAVWGVKPISQHLRMVPDFASFRGFLVLGGNQVSSIFDNNWVTGQSQSGLWLGKTDDLWGFGKPQGWGAVWRNTPAVVSADPAAVVSDPFLMTGFDRKVLHLRCDSADQATNNCALVSFAIDVDFTGSAGHLGATGSVEPWSTLDVVALSSAYAAYLFPPGFSAHWVRVCAVKTGSDPSPISVNLTAHFTYT